MFTLIVENKKGEKLNLTDSKDYVVIGVDGIASAKANINTSIAATMDGGVFNSSRADMRSIAITILPLRNVEMNRNKLYKYLRISKECRIYYKNGVRDVFVDGYVESIENDLFKQKQAITIEILCPGAYLKEINDIVASISEVLANFEFEFSIEESGIEFSTIEKATDKTVINNGDVSSGIIIDLIADETVVNPVIYNEFSQSFKINITMQKGDHVTINTYQSEKDVILTRDGITKSIIAYVEDDPEWFVLEPGDNLFTYECDSGSEFLQVYFKHYNLYEGV